MSGTGSKQYSLQAKRQIKGEAFFETLVSDYSLPHRIVSPKDLGIDYICEWVYGNNPTGILYAVQVKTLTVTPRPRAEAKSLNGLPAYSIVNPHLKIDDRTQQYWRAFGMPVYLFAIVPTPSRAGEELGCYYKRYTSVLTAGQKQEEQSFYKVNNGSSFMAFAHPEKRALGFARDLFIDQMRCAYYKGSIAYLNPRSIGLDQFPEQDALFTDLLSEYKAQVCRTYRRARRVLEQYCANGGDS